LPSRLLRGPNLLCGLLRSLGFLCGTLHGLSLLGNRILRGTRLVSGKLSRALLLGSILCGQCLIGSLLGYIGILRSALHYLPRGQACCLLRSQTGGLLRSLLGSLTRCFLMNGLLSGKLVAPSPLFGMRRFGSQPQLFSLFSFSLQPSPFLLIFNRLLHAQTRFFAGLCPGSRKIPVLRSVQVRPGIESRHILWRLVLV
jgi:hypothetical protein